MQPFISVIIPVYNHAHTLKKCVASILAQTNRPLEIIIVNDGSTDNFAEVAKSVIPSEAVADEGSIPINIISKKNQGATAARNRGFAASKGEYVIFWDADTLARPQMLQKMFAYLQKHPEASYAYSQFKFGWKKIKGRPFDAAKLKQVNYIDVTSLIRRSALTNPTVIPSDSLPRECGEGSSRVVGPFNPSLKRFQDWDLWLSLLEQGKIGIFIPEVLYKKIVHGRKGISSWLPSFMYKLPWKSKEMKKYESAKETILKKHNINKS